MEEPQQQKDNFKQYLPAALDFLQSFANPEIFGNQLATIRQNIENAQTLKNLLTYSDKFKKIYRNLSGSYLLKISRFPPKYFPF